MTTSRTIGPLQWAIIVLTTVTALVHIALAFTFPSGVDPIFLLNGLGYLVLLALLFVPVAALERYRNTVRWVLMAYTATTVILWLFPQIGARSTVAYITKADEIALLACLWLDWRRSRSA